MTTLEQDNKIMLDRITQLQSDVAEGAIREKNLARMLSEKEVECDESQREYQKRLSAAEQQHLVERNRMVEEMAREAQQHLSLIHI